MAIALKFGELEAMLAAMHDVPSPMRTAFQARLKNYHRLGYPKGIGGGRGKAASYGAGELVQMGLALELTQLGLTPERAIAVLEADEYPVFMAVAASARVTFEEQPSPCTYAELGLPDREPSMMFLYFDPAALSPWSAETGEDWASATFFYGGSGVVAENFVRWTSGVTRRLSLINVTAMLWRMSLFFEGDARMAFFNEVAAWADRQITMSDFDVAGWINGRVKRVMTEVAAQERSPAKVQGLPIAEFVEAAGLEKDAGELFETTDAWEGEPRPDLLLKLPGDMTLIVDDKVRKPGGYPLQAIKSRVRQLAAKPYSGQFRQRQDFVLLYLRTDQMFLDAVELERGLWDTAYEQGVILVSPATLTVVLREIEAARAAATAWQDSGGALPGGQSLMEGVLSWQQ